MIEQPKREPFWGPGLVPVLLWAAAGTAVYLFFDWIGVGRAAGDAMCWVIGGCPTP